MTTILYATDFSEASAPAFVQAEKLCKATGASLVIAHVLHFPPMVGSPFLPYAEETEEAMRRWCGHRLEEMGIQADAHGLRCETVLREETHAHEGILGLAAEKKADMIVLGTHGRTGLTRLVMGSVAARVISEAPCPVVTVRAA